MQHKETHVYVRRLCTSPLWWGRSWSWCERWTHEALTLQQNSWRGDRLRIWGDTQACVRLLGRGLQPTVEIQQELNVEHWTNSLLFQDDCWGHGSLPIYMFCGLRHRKGGFYVSTLLIEYHSLRLSGPVVLLGFGFRRLVAIVLCNNY